MNTDVLDKVIPLRGASHADVIRYSIEVPMRYAECFALLGDGRKVPLSNKRHFVAWSGHQAKRSLLFETGQYRVEARVDPEHPIGSDSPGHITSIRQETIYGDDMPAIGDRFIAKDGALYRDRNTTRLPKPEFAPVSTVHRVIPVGAPEHRDRAISSAGW